MDDRDQWRIGYGCIGQSPEVLLNSLYAHENAATFYTWIDRALCNLSMVAVACKGAVTLITGAAIYCGTAGKTHNCVFQCPPVCIVPAYRLKKRPSQVVVPSITCVIHSLDAKETGSITFTPLIDLQSANYKPNPLPLNISSVRLHTLKDLLLSAISTPPQTSH